MNILLVSQYFFPENFRINDVARSLSEDVSEVRVLTGKPNYPEGSLYCGYSAWGIQEEDFKGVHIARVPVVARGRGGALRLVLNYLSFIISGSILGPWIFRRYRVDTILVYCPSPLLQALPALLIGWIKRAPVVIDVQDLWPESLEATGYVRNGWLLGLVHWVVRFIYRHASLILVSSRPFTEPIRKMAPKVPIAYHPNSVDEGFCNAEMGPSADVSLLNSGFSVVFAGNVGSAQAVDTILDAAERLREEIEISIVIVGSGSELGRMRAAAGQRGLRNVHFTGRMPFEVMPDLMARASALLVTLANRPIFALTVPSKVQAYLAAGKPIIGCLNGEGARLIQEAGAGLCVPAEQSDALAEAILEMYRMSPECRARMGEAARAYYREHFDHQRLMKSLVGHLKSVAGARK